MALVAVDAVVNVVPHALMVRVCLALGMAVRAREDRVIVRVRMARGANTVRIAVIGWEPCVVKDGTEPRSGVVACLACGRKSGCNMVGIVGSLVIRLMAA